MALNEGQVLAGKYRIETALGEGGMGAVYVATNTVLQRRVALKVMNERFASMPAAVERFHREAIAASRVSHPSIVQVFDAGSHEGAPWIAMELLEGESLGERLERGPLPLEDVLKMAAGALSALAEVHDEGIVHRDLKPDNIFLAKSRGGDWVPKVLDFGVAKDTSEGQLSKLTATGAVVGTAYYLSPEQAKGLPDIDPRTDVYAMGVVLYECLSGDMPYEAETITQLIAKMFTEAPRPLESVAPHVPEPIADVVNCCLEQDRDRRFQTARSLLGALEAASQAQAGAKAKAGFAATAYAMSGPSQPGPNVSAAGSHPGSPSAGEHAGTMAAGGATGPGGHPIGHSPLGHAPHPGSAPGAHPGSAGGHGSLPGASPAGHGSHPGSAPGAHSHPGSSPDGHASYPGAPGAGHGVPGTAAYPQTALLPQSNPGHAAELAASLPGQRSEGSKLRVVGLVAALFLLGAAGTAGVGYVMFGGDGESDGGTIAHASEPADPVAAPSTEPNTATAPSDPSGAPPPGSDVPPVALEPTADAIDGAEDDGVDTDATEDGADTEASEDRSSPAARRRARRAARRARRAAGGSSENDVGASDDDSGDDGRGDDGRGDDGSRRPPTQAPIGPSHAQPVTRPAPHRQPQASPPRPETGLTQQQVMSTVQRRLGYLQQRCYARILARRPGLSGIITVSWTVQPNGRPANLRVVHNGTGDEWLARCTSRVVETTPFPAASNGQATPARYPFRFEQR